MTELAPSWPGDLLSTQASGSLVPRWRTLLRWLDRLAVACVIVATLGVVLAHFVRPALSTRSWLASLPITLAFYFVTLQFFLGIGVGLAALVAAARGRWVRSAITLGIAAAMVAPDLAHAWPAAPTITASDAKPLRVFSCNLLRGNADMPAVLAAIRSENPDVIAFQEYTHYHDAALSQRLADAYPYHKAYPSYDFQGLAIYSKRPFVEEFAPTPGTEHARLFAVTLSDDGSGRPCRFVNLHPTSPGPPRRIMANRQQVAWLLDYLAKHPQPTILAGDCNVPLASQQVQEIRAAGFQHCDDAAGSGFRWTWGPTRVGPVVTRIDHLFASSDFAVESSRVLDRVGSDHRPIVVEVRRK